MAKAFLTGIDLKNQRGQNFADGSAATDAVTLQQLQAFVRGLSWKASVRAASTADINLSAPGATIDGVTMISGDRFLAKNETNGATNGIYVWNGSAAVATRATDADTAAKLLGATVLVTEGTVNADKAFVNNTDAITLGTTTLTFVAFGGGGATYTAGNGITLASNIFSVLLDTNSGLTVSGTGLKLDAAVAVRKFAANIGDGAATSIPVTHNLGTKDVTWSLQEVATGIFVDTDAVATSVNVVTFSFGTAPTANAYRAVIHG
jgi:hypothetical protein